jgi:hypothetical protein
VILAEGLAVFETQSNCVAEAAEQTTPAGTDWALMAVALDGPVIVNICPITAFCGAEKPDAAGVLELEHLQFSAAPASTSMKNMLWFRLFLFHPWIMVIRFI